MPITLTTMEPHNPATFRRNTSNSTVSSEWSDPRDPTNSRGATPTSIFDNHNIEDAGVPPTSLAVGGSGTGGIRIPSFLQPLLGLEFIPYAPQHIVEGDSDFLASIEDDLTDFDDLPEDSLETTLEDRVDEIFDLRVALEEPVAESSYTPMRKGIKSSIGASFAKALKGRRRSEDHKKHAASPFKQKTQTIDIEWMRQQQAKLSVHQQRLESVQNASQVVQQRAAEIEARVAKVREEALQLQQALELSMQKLQLETQSLELTQDELRHLEHEAVRTAEQMEASVAAIRKGTVRSRGNVFSGMRKPSQSRERSATEDIAGSRTPRLLSPTDATRALTRALTGELPETESAPVRARANTDPRSRANTEPRFLRHSSSSSFMRVSDLEQRDSSNYGSQDDLDSASSVSSSIHSQAVAHKAGCEAFFSIDQDVALILDRLFKLGYEVVTDESDRFTPTRDTQAHLSRYGRAASEPLKGWPLHPWCAPQGTDVLAWTGGVPHKGFGHDWPVVKARGIVKTPARDLLTFLLDSSQIKKYNKMSQGRFDLLVLQEGVETTAAESEYGFAGDAKIMRSLNKPRMLPKTIEMLSLWYTRVLEHTPDAYMIVNRSVWENDSATTQKSSNLLRCEMLLGVILLRPCKGGEACEMTTITHVYSPGVPEVIAKRMAPGSAAGLIRDIQEQFR
jgi:hypothetical protein